MKHIYDFLVGRIGFRPVFWLIRHFSISVQCKAMLSLLNWG
jgi:hypothetical protein